MPSDEYLVVIEDGVARVTINRPERRNAISREMIYGLMGTVNDLSRNREVRAVVLTGAGTSFCAGGDIGGMQNPSQMNYEERLEGLRQRQNLVLMLRQSPKIFIARINGAAVGAGLGLAMACDFKIAARSARFGAAFSRIGLSGDYGVIWHLVNAVGRNKAMEMLAFSEIFDAETALDWGIVNVVVDDVDLDARVDDLVKRVTDGPMVALSYIKNNVFFAEQNGLSDALELEAHFQVRSMQTPDHAAAVAAFLEKRPTEAGKR
jgi:2-(1,2-epoxy-1,2-dihydrophenyl)acetyl-CoA isomerase